MEKTKKARAIVRSVFTKTFNALRRDLDCEQPVPDDIRVSFELLSEKMLELDKQNQQIFDYMLDSDATEEDMMREADIANEYKSKYLRIRIAVMQFTQRLQAPIQNQDPSNGQSQQTSDTKRTFKLPKIELKKFSGDVKEWLQFWSMFKKIHEDKGIVKEDKFQYLIQAMVTDSRASELVNSFPPTEENYDKVITSLKSRFGRDELLVEVYIRELLKLVLNNALKSNEKPQLSSLFDKLESHIRALESLGVTTDTCAAMLYPLVESSLPEELLRAWQRHTSAASAVPKDRLTKLMEFIQTEVESEERISMAVSGFGLDNNASTARDKSKKKPKQDNFNEIATAAGLLSTKSAPTRPCIFCGESHDASTCDKAKKVPLEERQRIVRQKNVCFNCLKPGHGSKQCRGNQKCAWCGKRHVLLMCRDMSTGGTTQKTPSNDSSAEKAPNENIDQGKLQNSMTNLSLNQEVFLQTLRVKLKYKNKEKVVRAVFDSGSHRSYVQQRTIKSMGYEPVGQQKIVHLLFGGAQSDPKNHKGYLIHLSSLDDTYNCNFVALDQELICQPIPSIDNGPWMQELRLENITITDFDPTEEPISVLIGADVMGKLLTGNLINLKGGPTAIETRLGWTLMGKKPQIEKPRNDAVLMVTSMFMQESKVSDLWSLDVLGITDPVQTKSNEVLQREIKDRFRQTIVVGEDGRYEVPLPWKENHPPLLSNKEAALKRLETVTKKLREQNLFEEYNQVLQEWQQERIIEEVPEGEMDKQEHYLPHRHVLKPNSTTRLRPVFDASARGKGSPSLNQCLETGPNLIELIPTMLLRFREKEFGVISDIKKAFLQISVSPADRNVLRFLWWDQDDPTQVKVFRHARVVFGVSSSPFLLGATIELHLDQALREATIPRERSIIQKLVRSFYVDNCVTSVDSMIELQQFREGAVTLMAAGRFDLRGWEYSGQEEGDLNTQTAVLGLAWDKRDDTLALNPSVFQEKPPDRVTKRVILAATHKVFDPIGFICPVLIDPKLLLQKIWLTELDWDTEVDNSIKEAFLNWFGQLHHLTELRIPRWVFGCNTLKALTFHTFVDASHTAYAAVVFARTETANGVRVQLLGAKSRVAPTKSTTIPRLELLAATVGARLMDFVKKTLGYNSVETYYWSDSTTVLTWIRQEKQWATFVWNRVQEIRQLSNPGQWCHVPGIMNPADLPSRGCGAKQLLDSRWWEGPDWLRHTPDNWPSSEYEVDEAEVNREVKKSASKQIVVMSNLTQKEEPWLTRYFSKYQKIIRMVGWMLRFLFNSQRPAALRRHGELSAQEVTAAELVVIRLSQEDSFNSEEDPRLDCLSAVKDRNGIIRSKALISNRKDKQEFRYPIILDPKHPVVKTLIEYEHIRRGHAGIQILMNSLRERFWILTNRRAMRSVINKCVICKRYRTTRLEAVPVALPEDRVRDAATFEITGVDLAGPIYLRGEKKAWICIYTCAVYRAVHLELVSSLATDVFLEAFRRFIDRRGRPALMYSDNGSNFVGARNLLRKINWNKVNEYSSTQKIEWRFNPPSAAWWGGWWERLIRIVKDILKRVLKKACLTYEEMNTTLCDCEAIINSRPITYLSEDVNQPMPLTPAMFLQDNPRTGVPDLDQIQSCDLNQRLRYRKKLREDLQKRFRLEYLGQLVRRVPPEKESRTLHVGDVVLVGNDNRKRLTWPLARVIELIPGKDGHARVARLKTTSGELVRPIQRLYPLEISSSQEGDIIQRRQSKRSVSKVAVNEIKELPKETEVDRENKTEVYTRSGRRVKAVDRLDI